MHQANPAFSSTVHLSPRVDVTTVVRTLCDSLTAGGAAPARTIGEHVAAGRLNAASLVGASLARDQERIQAAACQLGVAPDLLWLVAELAAGPLAFVVQRRLMTSTPAIADLTSAWPEGFCPICGSWPALAETGGGHRVLRCSFCAAGWQPAARRCVYCGDGHDGFAVTVPDAGRPHRQLELCDSCKGYLKVVPVDAPTPFPLLAVEDLASTDLDLVAAQRGFGRPPMLRFQSGD
jgi:FdhE protein